jgi:23S rRNA (guanosine2251-2'-O)-methyltransferase
MIYFALNNIRSAWNVGSIMRTCDALGFELIFVGYTPKPIGSSLPLVKKTAIGAENTVKWISFDHFQEVLAHFQDAIHIGIEISDKSSNIFDFLKTTSIDSTKDYILWLGNEISGLEDSLQLQLNHILHLPMKGQKESLNVSNTATATGYLVIEHLSQ